MADGNADATLITLIDARLDRYEDKMNKWVRGTYGAASKVQQTIDVADAKWNKLFFGDGPGKAIERVFSRSRLALIEEGGTKIGVFGSALESLGVTGIATAAGVAATVVALEGAHKALEFAAGIEEAANKLHVTTDALQEYRYALRLAGGDEAGADQALEAFSITLGKAQAGLPKAQRAFLELGFTKAQIKSFGDVDTALKAVTDRISGLGKNAQKDAVIEQLGLTSMKPLIDEGTDAMIRLRNEAQAAGVIMDEGLVARGAAAHKEFETLAKVVQVQLMSAFVDLAPVLIGVMQTIANIAREVGDIVDSFNSIENRRDDAMRREVASRIAQNAGMPLNPSPAQKTIIDANDKRVADLQAELQKRDLAKAASAPKPPGGGDLTDLDAARLAAEAARKAEQKRAASEQAIDTAEKAEAQAQIALAGSLEERARLEALAVDSDTKNANDKLAEDAAQDKITRTARDRAITANNLAATEKKEKIARDLSVALSEQRNAVFQQLAGYQVDELNNAEALARTSAERRALELQILRKRQIAEQRAVGTQLSTSVEKGDLTQNDANAIFGELLTKQRGEATAVIRNTMGPLESYLDGLKNIHDEIENRGVQAFQNLSDSLGQSAASALGLRGALGQFVGDLLSMFLQKDLASSGFTAGVFHLLGFAGGGDPPVGVPSIVGENGPELFVPKVAGTVIPNGALANGVRGGGDVHVHVAIDARDAVLTSAVQGWIAAGVAQGVAASRVLTRQDLARSASRQLGR